MSRPSNTLPNVVVVGGGGAGQQVSRALSAQLDPTKVNLILVTTRPYYIHYPATIRMSVTSAGHLEDRVLIPYDHNFVNGNGTLIVETVVAIQSSSDTTGGGGDVVLETGEKIPYTMLVLATGSIWSGPLSLPNTKAETKDCLASWRSRFEQANDIVMVGGGSVGIWHLAEFAGEIKEIWPNKNVTIVHGGTQLLNDSYPDKFRQYTERSVRRRGVQLVLGDYVDDIPSSCPAVVRTRKGKTINADLVVPNFGPRPNTSFIRASLGDHVVTPAGYVHMEPTMQVPGHPRIFVAGDIIDFPESKQVSKYAARTAVIVADVTALLSGQTPTNVYKKGPEMVLITIGSKGGVGFVDMWWGIMLGDWLASIIKSKTLLVQKARQTLGLTD